MHRPSTTIGILAVTQIVSWGSLYYAFTILAPGIRRDLGLAPELVFGAFSWALLVAGLAATPVGILLDRHGGRHVMAAGSFLCFLGMAWLARCTDVASYYAAWTLIGLAMALTLYEAAFAAIQRRFDAGARQAMSTLTLFGGFASTLFWPLTAWLETSYGWRDTYLLYGIVQLAVCMPLHLCLGADVPRAGPQQRDDPARGHTLAEAVRHPAFWTLALAFAANTFVFSAMAVHLIPLFERLGQARGTAVLLAALIGPMQVAGRVGEMAFARHTAPQTVGKLTFAMLPAALAVIALGGAQAWSVAAFCALYGLSNGILTILRGSLPRALFGREHYGAIAGAMAGPALVSKAAGPLIAAALLRRVDGAALLLSVLLAMSIASLALYLRAVGVGARPEETFDKRAV
ncbi:MFS transporter [Telluria mixta]|uniref:MFS transporter n=1 Tax=Telluria mixta TaxID=34071 RepID=A0ABT2BU23_9BURK|nr:MFS transporter [Telluria mixta]MCS0628630.1 MFS transporter [Telluria mixta]WEM93270.1 MFS transporter [Telluria mixta]